MRKRKFKHNLLNFVFFALTSSLSFALHYINFPFDPADFQWRLSLFTSTLILQPPSNIRVCTQIGFKPPIRLDTKTVAASSTTHNNNLESV